MDILAPLITEIFFFVMVAFVILAATVLALVFGFIIYCEVKGLHGKPEGKNEQEDPCDTCVRWSECNGVDKECPRR